MENKNQKGISPRHPVVGIFGHIDHGKSTLLDYIRKTNVVEKEAGGITQHLSAYEVTHKIEGGENRKITFLDTPGHEAFKAMRGRGARAADVAVLVVSSEDGVKPQTLEALEAIKEAKIPFIVAINKIDKPQANVEKTKQSLAENSIFVEGYGGTTPFVPISAKTGEGVSTLLDLILLSADLESLSGNKDEKASGVVIESSLDTKKGISATLLIKNGTLRSGDFVISRESFAPVRIMENFLGEKIEEASFSSPVRVIGWSSTPKVGDEFKTCENKKEAEKLVSEYQKGGKILKTEDNLVSGESVVIPVVVKADVLGSVEALVHELKKCETESVKIKIVDSSPGSITEKDVKSLSGTEGGVILGFSVGIDSGSRDLAERQSVTIVTFDVIYKITEWFMEHVKERTPKVEVVELKGSLKVLKVFSKNKDKQVVGGKVENGSIILGSKVKILRRGSEIGRGEVEELQTQKIKAREVSEGNECGLLVDAKVEIAPGDKLEAFVLVVK